MSEPTPPTTTQRETPSSVEITRNAKGAIQYAVKVYCEAGYEQDAAQRAIELELRLYELYETELGK